MEARFSDARSQLALNLLKWVFKNGVKIQQLAKEMELTVAELAILYGVMNLVTSIGLIGVRTFENLDSLEKLIGMSQTQIQTCYELASNYEPSSFD